MTQVQTNAQTGMFVVSLDFELLWGVRDHSTRETYGRNVLGAREAIPRILDLFAKNQIHATWAAVGFLFAESKDELMHYAPPPELRPHYDDPKLSSYSYLDEAGADERSDPYYFAPSLVKRIAQTPGQEIGTHTMSHYYCLESGQTDAEFEADLKAAVAIAAARGVTPRSIVFPRNQFSQRHLEICARHGLEFYRGNPTHWAYAATDGSGQTPLRRALRLVDAHIGVLGSHTHDAPAPAKPVNVPASRFLRPKAGRLSRAHPLHVAMVKRHLSQAAREKRLFHLWWHPHNFGLNIDGNLAALGEIVTHVRRLRDEAGLQSLSMREAA